jgi:competence protein ComEC
VLFEILNPSKNTDFKGNNASCVLKVSTKKHSVLLTGDIEKKAEKYLIKNHKDKLSSNVLLSPHHGSKTSSTMDFIRAVSPKTVVISSGFKNRFNHPAKIVTERYRANNLNIINTNCAGQIDIELKDEVLILQYRKKHQRFYMRQCTPP